MQRPLSVRLVAECVTTEDIVMTLSKQTPEEWIMCVCPTKTETWQTTLMNEEDKEELVLTGLIVNNARLEVMPLQDPPALSQSK